jgi:hypothetical protein
MHGHIVGEICVGWWVLDGHPLEDVDKVLCGAQRDLMSYHVNQPMSIIRHALLLDAIGKKPVSFDPFVPVTNAHGVRLRVSQGCDTLLEFKLISVSTEIFFLKF